MFLWLVRQRQKGYRRAKRVQKGLHPCTAPSAASPPGPLPPCIIRHPIPGFRRSNIWGFFFLPYFPSTPHPWISAISIKGGSALSRGVPWGHVAALFPSLFSLNPPSLVFGYQYKIEVSLCWVGASWCSLCRRVWKRAKLARRQSRPPSHGPMRGARWGRVGPAWGPVGPAWGPVGSRGGHVAEGVEASEARQAAEPPSVARPTVAGCGVGCGRLHPPPGTRGARRGPGVHRRQVRRGTRS
jgi:hypothetical protein